MKPMQFKKGTVVLVASAAVAFSGLGVGLSLPCAAQAAAQQGAATAASRVVGTVKAVSGSTLTLTTDAGTEATVVVAESARLVRTAPGQKDLTGATPLQLSEIQIGDRMLVRGKAADDGKSLVASSVVVMRKSDIAEKQAKEREDWQKRGLSGRVSAVDPAAGTVTVTTSGVSGKQNTVVRTSKTTVVRRYAPDSVKFDDASLASLDQIKAGDQLRARGNRSADGAEMTAEEIVAGTFRNIAGTVVSTDAATQRFTVKDLESKKQVVVRVTADSQLHKLSPMLAQMLAMQVKGAAARNGMGPQGSRPAMGQGNRPAMGTGPSNGGPGNGHGDIGQMLSRLPAVTVAELQKGDAVMIVTTQGTADEVSAITLLSGVEPILTASPNGDSSMILSPWNLGAGGGEGSPQ